MNETWILQLCVCFFATCILFSLSRTCLSWTHLQVIPAHVMCCTWLSALCLCMFTETFDITNSCSCVYSTIWEVSLMAHHGVPPHSMTHHVPERTSSVTFPSLSLSSCGSCVAVLSVTSGVRLNIYSHKQHLLFTSWHWSSASSPGMAVRQSMKYIHPSVRTLSLGISIKISLCSI